LKTSKQSYFLNLPSLKSFYKLIRAIYFLFYFDDR